MMYASGFWELFLVIMVLVSLVAGLAFLVVIHVAAMIPFRGRSSIPPDGTKRTPGGAARLFWLRVLSAVVLSLLLWPLMALHRAVLWPIAPGETYGSYEDHVLFTTLWMSFLELCVVAIAVDLLLRSSLAARR